MTTIQFEDVGTGQQLGRVTIDGDEMHGEGIVPTSIAQSWQDARRTTTDFVRKYRDWSNGYVVSRIETSTAG